MAPRLALVFRNQLAAVSAVDHVRTDMPAPTEKQLDAALDHAFRTDPEFARWFLSRTLFADTPASYLWSRSNHPWGKIRYVSVNPETGQEETVYKECETDVLVVFEEEGGGRFALHIENKCAGGSFTELQPELYGPRAEQWIGAGKFQNYSRFQTVLVAPEAFRIRNEAKAALFGCFVAHEDIAEHIALFGLQGANSAS